MQVALGNAAGGDGLVGFEAGQRRATTRLLDGEYPKVSSIFPSSVNSVAVIQTAALTEAVKRVSLVAERNTPVRLRFSEGQVAIEAGHKIPVERGGSSAPGPRGCLADRLVPLMRQTARRPGPITWLDSGEGAHCPCPGRSGRTAAGAGTGASHNDPDES